MADRELTQPYVMGKHAFPALWKFMLPEDAQWLKWPQEREATCASCPKVAQGVHHESTRCCTYFPEVPNFLLGFALLDDASRPLIEKQIELGHVLPTGQQIDAGQYRRAVESYADDLFGELTELVCPFLNSESLECGVYPYRNSVCSTFFCENDHGEGGHRFWEKTQDLVGHIEIALAQAAMEALGINVAEYVACLDEWGKRVEESFVPSRGWSDAIRKQLWGKWYGREAEFLVETANWVKERKQSLYELACEQTLYEARAFEGAVRNWLPETIRGHASKVNSELEGALPSPVSEFWYQVQLITRQLWDLPFGKGVWRLCSDLEFVRPEQNLVQLRLPGAKEQATVVVATAEQEAMLLIFQEPRVFNEALMESTQVVRVEGHREFLAECLRKGILVEAS